MVVDHSAKARREREVAGGAARGFYAAVLRLLRRERIPGLVGGTCAVNVYLGTARELKDLDLFCLAGDYPRILKACAAEGHRARVEDERWIAKVFSGKQYIDVIFGSANMVTPVTREWFDDPFPARAFGVPVRLLPPTELVWAKAFVADKHRYDGNEVAHLILARHPHIDWRRLLGYMEQHWEVLLMHVLRFRYIYPTERERVPRWLMDELLGRVADQQRMPPPRRKVCRGRLFSRVDFAVDVQRLGFADVVGDEEGE